MCRLSVSAAGAAKRYRTRLPVAVEADEARRAAAKGAASAASGGRSIAIAVGFELLAPAPVAAQFPVLRLAVVAAVHRMGTASALSQSTRLLAVDSCASPSGGNLAIANFIPIPAGTFVDADARLGAMHT